MIIGGGLAGLSAACALAERGLGVTLYESRRQVGGRAASFTPPGHGAPVDFCQHVLMRCCTNLLDFYGRIGVLDRVAFRPRLTFLDREGRLSSLGASALPAPLHLAPSLLRLKFLGPRDKLAIARAFAAMLREIGDGGPETGDAGDGGPETGDRPAASCVLHPASCLLPPADYPFSHWLSVHGQTARALEAFWRPVVVSALNVQPEHASTAQALMLFRDGFLRHRRAYELGLPMVPLSEIAEAARGYLESFGGRVVCRAAAAGIEVQRGAVSGVRLGDGRVVAADAYLSAVPPRALLRLLPESVAAAAPFAGLRHLEYAAIVAAHLWFDRVVTRLDHAALVDRPVDWVFNKSRVNTRVRPYGLEGGTYLTLVVSAAADLVRRPRAEILKLALAEVRDALPEARAAGVVRALVNRHAEATFAPLPGCDRFRPGQVAPIPNLFLAGDWTRTGWPATMEGAVRSGRLAAEAVLAAPGARETLLTPDLAVAPLARVVGRW